MHHFTFYRFTPLDNPQALVDRLRELARTGELMGTILVAAEGVNGSVSGPENGVATLRAEFTADPRMTGMMQRLTVVERHQFRRLNIRVKDEIITMGVADLDARAEAGPHILPADLCARLDRGEDILLLDTRNDYEVALGTFAGAVNPNLASFGDFPRWIEERASEWKDREIVTFCTGGVRCEKATSVMRRFGYTRVSQIYGGVLNYLDQTKERPDNHWRGDCFVFDERMAVDKMLSPTERLVCYVCCSFVEGDEADQAVVAADDDGADLIAPQEPKTNRVVCSACYNTMAASAEVRLQRGTEKQRQNTASRRRTKIE